MKLEAGTVDALHNNQVKNPLCSNPVLQIITLRKTVVPEGERQRYRMNLSDGVHYMRGIFSSDISYLCDEGYISKLSLIRVERYSLRTKDENVYLYIQSISEYENCNIEIGKPISISSRNSSLQDSNKNQKQELREQQNKEVKKAPIQTAQKVDSEKRSHNSTVKRAKVEESGCLPISSLNPFHNKWKIKGRIASKSDIRKFTNQKGEGKLFSFELADETAQVKITCFSDCVDVFYPIIELGKVYEISKGAVKMANKQYTNTTFEYEIVLDKNSEVTHVEDDETQEFLYNFTKISDITVGGALFDVLGVVKEIYPASTIIIKSTQKEQQKRDLILVDETGSIRVTLWGQKTEADLSNDTVIALKSVRAGDFNGINLSTISSSQVILNPDVSEAHKLLGWYKTVGKDTPVALPKREEKARLIKEVKDNELTFSTVKVTVMFLKEDTLWYESCPTEGCNKKVIMTNDGTYRCERCNNSFNECNYRYLINAHMGDFTGQIWISIFNEMAADFFGVPADEMRKLGDTDPTQLTSLVKSVYFKEYFIKIKSRQDNYNGETRTRYSALNITPIDYIKESKKLLYMISKANTD